MTFCSKRTVVMYLTTLISASRLLCGTMTHCPPAIQEISELRNSSDNIIGGQDCQHSSRIMSPAAEFVNNINQSPSHQPATTTNQSPRRTSLLPYHNGLHHRSPDL